MVSSFPAIITKRKLQSRMQLDNKQKVLEKAMELAFAMRAIMDQLVARDATPEGRAARCLLENSMSQAILNPEAVPEREEGLVIA